MRDICIERYEAFGTAGNASKIKVKSLATIQLEYGVGQAQRQSQLSLVLSAEQLAQLRDSLPPFADAQRLHPGWRHFAGITVVDFAAVGHSCSIGRAGCVPPAINWRCTSGVSPAPRPNLLILHGYLDHSGLFGHLIEYGLSRHSNVLIFDLPGMACPAVTGRH